MYLLKQSTAFTEIVGPILDSTGAEYASAVIGDLTITKNGTGAAMASAATLTYITNGMYTLVGTIGNSDTLNRLTITCNKSTYQMPPLRFTVLTASTFDAIVTNAATAAGGLQDVQRINGVSAGSVTGIAAIIGTSTSPVFNGSASLARMRVDVDTIQTNPVVNGGTITFPTNATLASTANITGGTITTVTTVTNQLTAAQIATGVWTDTVAGDFTTALSVGKSVMNGVTLGTGLTVAAVSGAVGSVTGAVGSVTGAVGSVTAGVTLAANQHVIVDSGTVTTVTNQLTAAQIATGVWQDTTSGDFTVASSIGKCLYIANVAPGAAGGHFIAGSNAATSIATALTANIIGNITGNLSGTVGTVTTLTNLPSIPANWLTAAGIAASALNGKGDWMVTYVQPTGFLAATFPSAVSSLTQAQVSGGAYAINSSSFAFNSALDFTTTMKTSLNAATPVATISGYSDAAYQLQIKGTRFYGNVYFVSTVGNDSNTGKTPAAAFLTIAHAISIAVAGDAISVGTGTFAHSLQVLFPSNVDVWGVGKYATVLTSSLIYTSGAEHTCFCPGANSSYSDFSMVGNGTSGNYQLLFGWGNGDVGGTGVTFRNLYLEGDSDCFYSHGQTGVSWAAYNCIAKSKFDCIFVGDTANTPGAYYEFYDCELASLGPTSIAGQLFANGISCIGGQIVFNRGQITAGSTSGSASLTDGVRSWATGAIVLLQDTVIQTSAAAGTVNDLRASGGGIIIETGCMYLSSKNSGTITSIPRKANSSQWNSLSTVALPLIPTVAGRSLDVSATGEAGIDWANVGSPTATVSLDGTTIANTTNAPTVGDFTAAMKTSITTATMDLATSGHTTAGTFGAAIVAAGNSGDPWGTLLPGSYTSGTAGFIVGNGSSGSAPTAIQNADALLDRANGVEAGLTPRQAMRLWSAALVGIATGGGTTTVSFYNAVANSKPRITATVDTFHNRTHFTFDLS